MGKIKQHFHSSLFSLAASLDKETAELNNWTKKGEISCCDAGRTADESETP
jgi:hypothetical protein